ncbi:MAG TPA: hypothetical protein VMV86_06525 [Methanosarcinales archaeon]|nr:hypothetical protein [Methanosarcinales archaeon]
MYRWNHHPWCAYMQGGDDEECTCGRDDIVAKAGAAIAKAKRVQV